MNMKAHSYRHTRWNALSWGVTVDGILPCRGRKNCAYGDMCERLYPNLKMPPLGSDCLPEKVFAWKLANEMRESWRPLEDYLDEPLDGLVIRAVLITLKRQRAMARQSHATEYLCHDPEDPVWHELALTDRYLTALSNEFYEVLAKIDQAYLDCQYARWRSCQTSHDLFDHPVGSPIRIVEYPGPDWDKKHRK